MSGEWWGFIFLMVIMKIPIGYLAGVVWYACKSPRPPEPALKAVEAPQPEPEAPCPWRARRRGAGPRRPLGPTRRVPSPLRSANAYAHRR